jgi:hypothetical protein
MLYAFGDRSRQALTTPADWMIELESLAFNQTARPERFAGEKLDAYFELTKVLLLDIVLEEENCVRS